MNGLAVSRQQHLELELRQLSDRFLLELEEPPIPSRWWIPGATSILKSPSFWHWYVEEIIAAGEPDGVECCATLAWQGRKARCYTLGRRGQGLGPGIGEQVL
jgi:hypothetical protein